MKLTTLLEGLVTEKNISILEKYYVDNIDESGVVGGDGRKPRINIPEVMRKNLVIARYHRPGGWGRPSHTFILYITPTGRVVDIAMSASMPSSQITFNLDDVVSLNDLIRFEDDSDFDLQMSGRIKN